MRYRKLLRHLSIAGLALLVNASGGDSLPFKHLAVLASEVQAVERTTVGPAVNQAVHPASPGMRIISVPALVPDKYAWVTIVDMNGRPAAGVSLWINGHAQDSDSDGEVRFTVPNAGAVSLAIVDAEKHDVDRKDFALTPDGLLVSSDSTTGMAVSGIEKAAPSHVRGPLILYAPLMAEPGKQIVIIGSNFDTREDQSKVFVDGLESAVTSASPIAVVSSVPPRCSVGPIKELFLSEKDGLAANTVELDVVKPEITYDKNDVRVGRDVDARVVLVGTNMPAIVTVTNDQPSVASLSLAGGASLGDQSTVVIPGGDENALAFRLHIQQNGVPSFHSELLYDEPGLVWVSKPGKSHIAPGLLRTIYEAQIIKLKRRLIAVENRINEDKQLSAQFIDAELTGSSTAKNGVTRSTKAASSVTDSDRSASARSSTVGADSNSKHGNEPNIARNPDEEKAKPVSVEARNAEMEKVNSALRALAVRQRALTVALNARKQLFLAAGATEQAYLQALDTAAGGSYYLAERDARNVEVVPNNPIVASSLPVLSAPPVGAASRRMIRALAEPRIKLLPPLDMDMFPVGQAPTPGEQAKQDAVAAARSPENKQLKETRENANNPIVGDEKNNAKKPNEDGVAKQTGPNGPHATIKSAASSENATKASGEQKTKPGGSKAKSEFAKKTAAKGAADAERSKDKKGSKRKSSPSAKGERHKRSGKRAHSAASSDAPENTEALVHHKKKHRRHR